MHKSIFNQVKRHTISTMRIRCNGLSVSCPMLSVSCPILSVSCPMFYVSCPMFSVSCPGSAGNLHQHSQSLRITERSGRTFLLLTINICHGRFIYIDSFCFHHEGWRGHFWINGHEVIPGKVTISIVQEQKILNKKH